MLSVCDGMLAYDRKPHLVPVTRHLLTLAHQAHASYNAYLEKKKLEESEAKQKKAEEEAAAAARKEAEKNLKEEGKKLQSLEESLKKTKTEQHAKEKLTDCLMSTHRSREQVEESISNSRCDRHCRCTNTA